MPTYRSITLSLTSQYDVLTIPEYPPPSHPLDPFASLIPTLIDQATSCVTVFVPTYPASQFWLSYSIAPPHPPRALYYFKLFLGGRELVSWGVGEEDGWKGRVVFALFEDVRGRGLFRQSLIERRAFYFGPEIGHRGHTVHDMNEIMEVRVFRSKARLRIQPHLHEYPSNGRRGGQRGGAGVGLVNAGILPMNHPTRFYKYALLDPLDQPFATFRYHFRTWDQLEALGIISPPPSTESSSTHSSEAETEKALSPNDSNDTVDSLVSLSSQENGHTSPESDQNAATNLNKDAAATNTCSTSTKPKPKPSTSTTTSTPKPTSSPPQTQPLHSSTPFTLPRPPTPPPTTFDPQKPLSHPPTPSPYTLAQLPPTIPQTFTAAHALNTQASKESFQTLIRTRLASPDRGAFRLRDPSEEGGREGHGNGTVTEMEVRGGGMGGMGRLRMAVGGKGRGTGSGGKGHGKVGSAGSAGSVGGGVSGREKRGVSEGGSKEERKEERKMKREERRREGERRGRLLWEEI